MGIFLFYAKTHLCNVTIHRHIKQTAMDKQPTKLSVLFSKPLFLSRLFRRKNSAFARQRRLLRGDYKLF